jgi:hypothetical protein
MQRTLDFSAVWSDTTDMLQQHREAIIAMAGLLMFVPNWAAGFFVGQADVEGLASMSDILAAQGQHMIDNMMILIPLSLVSFFGGIAVLTLLLRTEMARVSDALAFAVKLLPVYFLVSILTGILTGLGVLALFIGMLYLAGRLMPVGPVVVAEPGTGILGSIGRGWELTRGLGWKCFALFMIVFLVAYISIMVTNLIIGTICALIAGPDGVPLIETLFSAMTETGLSLVILTLQASLYRHLQRQGDLQLTQ